MDPLRLRLRIFWAVLLAVVVVGTFGFMLVERMSLPDAFYFTVVTVATVGYGDIHPLTQAGKVLAIALILMGVGSFLGVIANATEMMLSRHEKLARLEKLNMVIGVFFSELGTRLIEAFSHSDPNLEQIRQHLVVDAEWNKEDFARVGAELKAYEYRVEADKVDLAGLKQMLLPKRDTLVHLLENPSLLEHESFTETLRTIFHLTEELSYRDDLTQLPESDREHLAGDVKRAYSHLVQQWLEYMRYLKNNYPYLFSLAMRTNPFDRTASPVVK